MWWRIYAVVFYALLCSVFAEGEDNAPYLRVIAKPTVYNVGEKKALYCEGVNLKEPMGWYNPAGAVVQIRSSKNNRIFVERHNDETSEKKLIPLIIQSAQLEDTGNWTCKSGDLSESIQVLVGEKVFFPDRYNNTIVAEEAKTMRLDCVAKGSPAPVVQWYKDVVPIYSDENKHKYILKKPVSDNYQLEIRNLDHMDAGEYICKVTQDSLSHYTDKHIELLVQHKPLLVDSEKQEDGYITKYKTQEIYAILNETKNISCNTKAYPRPTFEWHKRNDNFDTRIPATDTIFTSENGTSSTLMLKLYNESFLGEYKCTAKNLKGAVSIIFHVSVGNRPDPPDFVKWLNGSDSDLWFNITCSQCPMFDPENVAENPKNLILLGYNLQFAEVVAGYNIPDWEKAIEIPVDIIDPEDTIFVVGPLPNNTEWYSRVRSRNAAGYSTWVDLDQHPKTTNFAIYFVPSVVFVASCIIMLKFSD